MLVDAPSALQLVQVTGWERGDDGSLYNKEEMAVALNLVDAFITANSRDSQCVILTPYKAQARRLQTALKGRPTNYLAGACTGANGGLLPRTGD